MPYARLVLCLQATGKNVSAIMAYSILPQGERRASSPFRRIREEEIEVDARVADNSFDAKVRRMRGLHHP